MTEAEHTQTGPVAPRRMAGPVVAAVLALALAGGFGGGYVAQLLSAPSTSAGDGPTVLEAAPAVAGDQRIASIAQAVLPSVVYLEVTSAAASGVGSGFVISADGYIVTNAHVIAGAAEPGGKLQVSFSDGTVSDATVVGRDVEYDIAVVKVDRANLKPLAFGDSDQVAVGASVVAVGAPLGLDATVTSGIVSALDRPVTAGRGAATTYINAIQTDAAINPGNSGGPLLDLRGQVIGVNSALAQLPDAQGMAPAGSIGLGFAIPANQVKHTADQLIATGSSDHPVMGVLVDPRYSEGGAKVLEEAPEGEDTVVDGGPADQAGIRPGEVIVAIDGVRIRNSRQLIVVLRSHAIGDTVDVTVRDNGGAERIVPVTLQGSSS